MFINILADSLTANSGSVNVGQTAQIESNQNCCIVKIQIQFDTRLFNINNHYRRQYTILVLNELMQKEMFW